MGGYEWLLGLGGREVKFDCIHRMFVSLTVCDSMGGCVLVTVVSGYEVPWCFDTSAVLHDVSVE